mgnify:FL=1
MVVYVVSEENHGDILYAASEDAAKRALVDTNWVGRYGDIWCPDENERWGGHNMTLDELYGENWKEEFLKFSHELLENMGFHIKEYEVCE